LSSEGILQEIETAKCLRSSFIINIYGAYIRDKSLWIVKSYCDCESVRNILERTEEPFEEHRIASIIEDCLKGLKYLHSNGKIHDHIKASNILLTSKGEAKLNYVIPEAEDPHETPRRHFGTPCWMSPEAILTSVCDFKSDIWSLGITLIEMAQVDIPHSDLSVVRVIISIAKYPSPTLSNPDRWSFDMNDFLAKCLEKTLSDRPSASELLQHPFIKSRKA